MKIIDETETKTTTTTTTTTAKNKDRKEQRGDTSYSEDMRAKLFCCASAFLQLICKVSLVFESNLELALSIILKERDLY